MFDGCRPTEVLRLSAETVNGVIVVYENTSRRGELAGLVVAAVSSREAPAVYPVAPVKPIAVKETGGREKVGAYSFLDGTLRGRAAGVRAEADARAVMIEFLGTHVDEVVIARKNVGKADGHIERLVPIG